MTTLSEINAKLKLPYSYEEPYYNAGYTSIHRTRSGGYEKSYYDVHGGFEQDIRSLINEFPYLVQLWIWDRMPTMRTDNSTYILAIIGLAHFRTWGDLCP